MKNNLLNKILIFSIIIVTLYMFCNQINEHFYKQDPFLSECVVEVQEYFPDAKNLRFYEGDESYTLNKEKVYICIKDKHTQELYDKNIIKYVILHEYTHSICPEIGHTALYQRMFNEVLKEAIEKGIYDPNVKIPSNYCK